MVADLDLVVLTGADSRLADLDGTFQIGLPHRVHVPGQKGQKRSAPTKRSRKAALIKAFR